MFKHTSLSTATVLALCPAGWAQADITADDVFQNMRAYAQAFGASFIADVDNTATGLTLSDASIALTLSVPPQLTDGTDLGNISATMALPDFALTNNSDGTVTVATVESGTFSATLEIPEMEALILPMTFQSKNVITIASGTPGNVTYDYSADSVDMQAAFEIPAQLAEDLDAAPQVNIAVTQENTAGTVTVAEGDVITVTGGANIGHSTQFVETRQMGGDVQSSTNTSIRDQVSTVALKMPTGDVSLFNLAKALRDGLSLNATIAYGNYAQTETVSITSELGTETKVSTGASTTTIALDTAGLHMDGSAKDAEISVEMPFVVPVPMTFAIDTVEIGMQLPLLKTEDFATFAYSTTLKDFTMGDSLWSMFDPAGQLYRDPAQFDIDLTGSLKHNVEWLDILSLEGAMETLTSLPVMPEDVSVNALSLSAADARVDAKGAFSFDGTDMVTYPGMPRPDGAVTVDFQGLNRLMDTLTNMGLLPEDQVMGVRMMLGGFTKPVGEDHLTSTIEMTPEGHVTANGQRIK